VEPLKQNNTTSYRVRVGPELKRSDAQAIRDKLKETMQLEGIIVPYP
jgi:cell division septation protein DedD